MKDIWNEPMKLYEFPKAGDKIRYYMFCDSCKRDFVASKVVVMPKGDDQPEVNEFLDEVLKQGIKMALTGCPDCGDMLDVRIHQAKYDKDFLTPDVVVVDSY